MIPPEPPPEESRDRHPEPPAGLRPAFRLLRLVRWIVPHSRRRTWEREWRAELIHAWKRDPDPRPLRPVHRTLASIPHALALRRQRWSLDMLLQDLRYALRTLRHAPGFTTVAVLTLTLAIGANVAIFGVVHSLLVEPFPVPHGDRLVYLWRSGTQASVMVTPSPDDVAAWREAADTLDAIEPINNASVTATGGSRPEVLTARRVGPGFLPMLGVAPAIGRNFTEADAAAADDGVVLLAWDYWQRRFAGDPEVIGSELQIDDHAAVVIGVMPRYVGLHMFEAPEVWLPAPPDPGIGAITLGRMAPGVGPDAVNEELEAIARHRAGDAEPQWLGTARPPGQMIGTTFRVAILVLQGAVGFVLLIAGANVVNLMLARGTVQRRELAIRAALGAGRGRLIRQLMTESALISLAGGLLGLAVAGGGLRLIRALRPARLTQLELVRMDAPVIGFALALAVGAGLLFGLASALQLARRGTGAGLRDSLDRPSLDAESSLVRRGLVVAEVALAFMLLAGAGLMIHSFMRLQAADPGFVTEGLMAMQLELPQERYPEAAQQLQFAESLRTRVESALGPSVEGIALASTAPGTSGILFGTVNVEGQPEPLSPGTNVSASVSVDPGYFRTVGIPVLRGRGFTPEEITSDAGVVVVSESFARTHFADGEALGKRVGFGDDFDFAEDGSHRVVGVVADAKQLGLNAGSSGDTQIYFPYRGRQSLAVILRAGDRPLQHADVLRRQVWDLDPELPIRDVAAGLDLLDGSFESPRFQTALMAAFAGVALLLALVGIYGMLMYAVSQRVHEIGVRMALGARQRDVLGLVVRQGMVLVLVGLALGLAGGLGLSRYVSSLLYELEPTDPLTFGVTAALLAAVGLTATALPALRASRVDPLVALREE